MNYIYICCKTQVSIEHSDQATLIIKTANIHSMSIQVNETCTQFYFSNIKTIDCVYMRIELWIIQLLCILYFHRSLYWILLFFFFAHSSIDYG